jgi:DNA polymerase III epsilon subunit-like protein
MATQATALQKKCSFCREPGHTIRTCSAAGVQAEREKRNQKKQNKTRSSANTSIAESHRSTDEVLSQPVCSSQLAEAIASECGMGYVVLDLETTGLEKHDRIVQFAAKSFSKTGHRLEEFSLCSYIRSPVSISPKATLVNRITNAMVRRQGKDPKEVMQSFVDLVSKLLGKFSFVTLIAHNGITFRFSNNFTRDLVLQGSCS